MSTGKRIIIPVFAEVPNYIAVLSELGCEAVPAGEVCDTDDFDALVLPGGGDVDPCRYGEEMNGSWTPNPELDGLQFTMLDRFVKAGKPVFGICRGLQVINVYFGGSLVQDIPEAPRHRRNRELGVDNVHMTAAEPGSFLAELYGESFAVNSAHHQAVKTPGEGLRVVQRSDDGIIEALCHETLPVYAVQWHPERMCYANRRGDTVDGSAVLRWFVERI